MMYNAPLRQDLKLHREACSYAIDWEVQLVIIEGPEGGFYVWAVICFTGYETERLWVKGRSRCVRVAA